MKKILVIGNFSEDYSRNRVILEGFKSCGAKVILKNLSSKKFNLIKEIYCTIKTSKDIDFIYIPFFGHNIVPYVRLFTKKRIYWDAFVSAFLSNVYDRKNSKFSFVGIRSYLNDFIAAKCADLISIDTKLHRNYLGQLTKTANDKFLVIPVIAAPFNKPIPNNRYRDKIFKIGFYGNYIPIQGVDKIIKAFVKLYSNYPNKVELNLLGKGEKFNESVNLAEQLNVPINFMKPVNYDDLASFMDQQDVMLCGHFGDSIKAEYVVANKTLEALSRHKAIICSDVAANRELLRNGENAVLCERNIESIYVSLKKIYLEPHLQYKLEKGAENISKTVPSISYYCNNIINFMVGKE